MTATNLASPIHAAGEIAVDDVVDVAIALAQLDRPAAVAFIAGLFGFDPGNPPSTVPFGADLDVSDGAS